MTSCHSFTGRGRARPVRQRADRARTRRPRPPSHGLGPRGARPGRSETASVSGRVLATRYGQGVDQTGEVEVEWVRPPSECVVSRRVTVFQRMSMSGWWSISSPTPPRHSRTPARRRSPCHDASSRSRRPWRSHAMPSPSAPVHGGRVEDLHALSLQVDRRSRHRGLKPTVQRRAKNPSR